MEPATLKEIALRVSQYFRDFLESDFKRQQAPRRRVVLQSDSGFRAGMRVGTYPELQKDVWKLLSKASSADLSLSMQPRKYTRPIGSTLKRVIEEQIAVIPETSVLTVRQSVVEQAVATLQSWRLLRKLRCSTTRITSLVQAVLTLHLASSGR